MPTLPVSLVLYVPVVIFIQIRIIIRMIILISPRKKVDEIQRKGMLLILISVVALFLSVITVVVFTFEGAGPGIIISAYIFRAIFIIFLSKNSIT